MIRVDIEILITRNGHSVAHPISAGTQVTSKRIGLLKGKFRAPSLEELDEAGDNIAREFFRPLKR